jgi:hypothetical protein
MSDLDLGRCLRLAGEICRLRDRVAATDSRLFAMVRRTIGPPRQSRSMTDLFQSFRLSEWGSATLVIASAMIVGRYAAIGMTPQQWACGVFAVAGSVGVAVMVRVWPAPQPARIED